MSPSGHPPTWIKLTAGIPCQLVTLLSLNVQVSVSVQGLTTISSCLPWNMHTIIFYRGLAADLKFEDFATPVEINPESVVPRHAAVVMSEWSVNQRHAFLVGMYRHGKVT